MSGEKIRNYQNNRPEPGRGVLDFCCSDFELVSDFEDLLRICLGAATEDAPEEGALGLGRACGWALRSFGLWLRWFDADGDGIGLAADDIGQALAQAGIAGRYLDFTLDFGLKALQIVALPGQLGSIARQGQFHFAHLI